MKKQLPGFILGFLCAVLLFGMSISGYALITERTAIEVDPINVMVNGEVFQPRNAQGELVDVFAYNGTTYAPLRALAEAYGLEVGYDAEKNLATVSKPGAASNPAPDEGASALPNFDDWSEEEEAAYQEFREMWEISTRGEIDGIEDDTFFRYIAWYVGDKQPKEFEEWLANYGEETLDKLTFRMMVEILDEKNGNLALRYNDKLPAVFGMQIVNGATSKVVDSVFHNGLM